MKALHKLLIYISLVLLAGILITSCKKNEVTTPQSNSNQEVMEYQADSLIIPEFQSLYNSSDSLTNSILNFQSNINSTNLLEVQKRFISTYLKLCKVELYQFGPIEDELLWNKMNDWPIKSSSIESFITTNNSINDTMLTDASVYVKGLPVLEYLVFNGTTNQLLTKFQDTTANAGIKRKQYVVALAKDFQKNISIILNKWKNDYRSTYVNSSAFAVTGGINVGLNRTVQLLSFMKANKVSYPMGITDGIVHINEGETPFAKISIKSLNRNLQSVDNYLFTSNSKGVDDLLYKTKPEYKDTLRLKIDNCYTALAAINEDLTISTVLQPDKINTFYTRLRELEVFIKVDVISMLGGTLTFSSNDGD